MIDEPRDPDIQALRAHWQPPSPSPSLDQAVLVTWRARFSRRPLHFFWMPAAAAALVALSFAILATVQPPAPVSKSTFVPVRQPRMIVVTQGEQP
jgi:hypothetical protein